MAVVEMLIGCRSRDEMFGKWVSEAGRARPGLHAKAGWWGEKVRMLVGVGVGVEDIGGSIIWQFGSIYGGVVSGMLSLSSTSWSARIACRVVYCHKVVIVVSR